MTFPWQIVIKPTTLNLLSIIHQNSHIYTSLFFTYFYSFTSLEAIASEHHYWNKHNGNSKKVLPVSKRFFYEFRKIMGCVGMWIPVEKWKMIQRCAISDFMSGLPLHRSPQRKKRPVCECFEQECELSVKKTLILWSWVKLHLILLSSSS